MSRRRCCCGCPEDCDYFRDTFTRVDVGDDWTVVSGSWSIASNKLTISDSNAIITCNQKAPSAVDKFIVIITFGATAAGDCGRIYFNAGSQYVEIEFDTGGSVAYYRLVDGSTTKSGRQVATSPWLYNLTLCYDGSVLHCGVDSFEVELTDREVRLGTGSTENAVTFDNFAIRAHDDECDGCDTCPVEQCEYANDPFTNRISPLLWSVTSGTWSISSGKLVCTAAGTLTSTVQHPDDLNDYTLQISCIAPATAPATIQIKVDDGDAYAQIEWDADHTYYSIYANGALTDTWIMLDQQTSPVVKIILRDGEVAVKFGTEEIIIRAHTSGSSVVSIAVVTVTGSIKFDNFTLRKSELLDENETSCDVIFSDPCEACLTTHFECDPRILHVDLGTGGTVGTCPTIAGEFLCSWMGDGSHSMCLWQYDETPWCKISPWFYDYTLTIGGYIRDPFRVLIAYYRSGVPSATIAEYNAASAVCDDLTAGTHVTLSKISGLGWPDTIEAWFA